MTLRVEVQRLFGNGTWTVGVLLVDELAKCFTLEDAFQTEKVRGKTRIPAGLYELELKPIGQSRFDGSNWNKPPLRYRGMLRVRGVKGFEEILIHPGNSDGDTEGCLLVGLQASLIGGTIGSSIQAYLKIYPLLADEIQAGQKVMIQFRDLDRPVEALVA